MSELDGCITTPAQAPAGTKRLRNLLRSAGTQRDHHPPAVSGNTRNFEQIHGWLKSRRLPTAEGGSDACTVSQYYIGIFHPARRL